MAKQIHIRIIGTILALATSLSHAQTEETLRNMLLGLTNEDTSVRSQTLNALAATGDQRLNAVLEAYRIGGLYVWNNQVVLELSQSEDENLDTYIHIGDIFSNEPLSDDQGQTLVIKLDDLQALEPARKERREIANAIIVLSLSAKDLSQRLSAVRKVGTQLGMDSILDTLDQMAMQDNHRLVRRAAKESAAMIRFRSGDEAIRLDAAATLGRLKSVPAKDLLNDALSAASNPLQKQITTSLVKIKNHERVVSLFNIMTSGISSGSILVLMGLGLAITFGMMGIINMAHGEMMMIGAYATYCMQELFHHSPDNPASYYYIVSLPCAFLLSAAIAGVIELLIVRHLYKRPLESLLATWGIGLIMIQSVRSLFGDNRATNSPMWLQGGLEWLPGMTLSYNRLFIVGLTILCVIALWAVFRYTPLGLKMRSTIQNRDMAAAMGINTRVVDSITFMIGAGLAGVAGYAMTGIGGITPDMGQNYIVDSFLVVVTGGVGNLAGVVCSGLLLGLINKILEGTLFGAVWAKILVLCMVILFIQFKPSGLFSPKGRLVDG